MEQDNEAKLYKYLLSWQEEKQSVYLYLQLAKSTKGAQQVLFTQLANEAEKQAKIWEENIAKSGGKTPEKCKIDYRTKIVSWLIRFFPLKQLRLILSAMKVRGMSSLEPPLIEGHPFPKSLEDIGGRHAIGRANNLRAAIFGINDGLVSNASLILGIIGANAEPQMVFLTGIAGLLAGAFSMAAGEYISVRSQRELYEYQIGLEKSEIALYPEAEAAELALIYQSRGLNKEQAENLAKSLMADPNVALDVLARDELGINPQELVSPYGAAFYSFASFMIGALLPIIPYLIAGHTHHLYATLFIISASLFLLGALVSFFTGKNAIKGAFRMLSIGLGACLITFLIGHALGAMVL